MPSNSRLSRDEFQQHIQSILDERLDGLSRRIDAWLEDASERSGALKRILEESRKAPLTADEIPLLAQGTPAPGDFLGDLDALATRLQGADDQTGILAHMMDAAGACASRLVLFVTRADAFRGWSARGLPEGTSARALSVPIDDDTLLKRACLTAAFCRERPSDRQGNGALASGLGGAPPVEMVAAPLWVRDRVAAILYADAVDGGPWMPSALAVMASMAALSLETLPIRSKFPRPVCPDPVNVQAEPVAQESPAAPPADPPAAEAAIVAAADPAWETTSAEASDEAEARDRARSAMEEEARRFATLLVSEIVLYNEKQLEEGRRSKDLYERLKDDIDRSYRMFEQRISSKLPGAESFFREELVRALAGGDESAIRLPWA